MDSKRYEHAEWENMAKLLQRAWKRFINVVPGEWKPELTFEDYPCMRQERGNNLCGYYVCDFIREMAVYRDAEDAIHHSRMISLRDSLITEARIRAIQEELAGFFLNEALSPKGEYYRQYIDLTDTKRTDINVL
nr:uncharacterized protein LOC127298020 [Lolium perenne]